MVAGIRRILLILASISALTAALSLLAGLAAGGSLARALATGFYLVGAFLMIAGLLSGVRGPMRSVGTSDRAPALTLFGLGLTARGLRRATHEERHDTLFTAVLFLGLGLVLVAVGVAADPNVELL